MCVAAAIALRAASASAQRPTVDVQPSTVGDCLVVVNVRELTTATTLEVQLDKNRIARADIQPPAGVITTLLKGPLEDGDEIRVIVGRDVVARATPRPLPQDVAPSCKVPAAATFDTRSNFEVTGYMGAAFDNFAPNEVGNYRNPVVPTDIKSRFIAGTDAQLRFWPRDPARHNLQVWLGAETLHGVRTADVDCNKSPEVPVCQQSQANASPQKFLWILEHASTLEVFLSPRVELFPLPSLPFLPDSEDTPIKVYVGGRFGFLATEGAATLYRNDHIGGGLLAPVGPFAGSFVEVGWGRSAMFHEASGEEPHWDRLKIDATLMFDFIPGWKDKINPFKRMASATRGFVELYVDQSPGSRNPQSVQSFAGIQFDFRDAFGR